MGELVKTSTQIAMIITLLKPLNYRALFMTYHLNHQSKLLGLEVLHLMILKLKKEYLFFLAEILLHLKELLEEKYSLIVYCKYKDFTKAIEKLTKENLKLYNIQR